MGAERVENLIRNDHDKSEFTKESLVGIGSIASSQMTVSRGAKPADYTTYQKTGGKGHRGEQSRKKCTQQTAHKTVLALSMMFY